MKIKGFLTENARSTVSKPPAARLSSASADFQLCPSKLPVHAGSFFAPCFFSREKAGKNSLRKTSFFFALRADAFRKAPTQKFRRPFQRPQGPGAAPLAAPAGAEFPCRPSALRRARNPLCLPPKPKAGGPALNDRPRNRGGVCGASRTVRPAGRTDPRHFPLRRTGDGSFARRSSPDGSLSRWGVPAGSPPRTSASHRGLAAPECAAPSRPRRRRRCPGRPP